jgi:hypothetical protein
MKRIPTDDFAPPWIVKVKDFRLNSYAMPRITKDELYFALRLPLYAFAARSIRIHEL